MAADQRPGAYPYFETPERAHCIDTIARHLRRLSVPIYISGPEGAGKSRFAARLAEVLSAEMTPVILRCGPMEEIRGQICSELGLEADGFPDWPADLLKLFGDRRLLVLADDADTLAEPALRELLGLNHQGASLILLGRGRMTDSELRAAVRFLILPPFSRRQAADYLVKLGAKIPSQAGFDALYQRTGGWPGLLRAATNLAAGGESGVTAGGRQLPGVIHFRWLILILFPVVLIGLLVFSWPRISDKPRQVKGAPDSSALSSPVGPDMKREVLPSPLTVAPRPERSEQHAAGVSASRPATAPLADPVALDVAEVSAHQVPPEPEPATPVEPEPVAQPESRNDAVSRSVLEPIGGDEEERLRRDAEWLQGRRPDHFTIQLIGAGDIASILKYAEQHHLAQGRVFRRLRQGEAWYSLVLGDFPNIEAARTAAADLPAEVKATTPWPRSFDSVRQQMGEAAQ